MRLKDCLIYKTGYFNNYKGIQGQCRLKIFHNNRSIFSCFSLLEYKKWQSKPPTIKLVIFAENALKLTYEHLHVPKISGSLSLALKR